MGIPDREAARLMGRPWDEDRLIDQDRLEAWYKASKKHRCTIPGCVRFTVDAGPCETCRDRFGDEQYNQEGE